MESQDGIPSDDAGLLRRSLDGLSAGAITIAADGKVTQANASALRRAPTIVPGADFRRELERLTHVEKVDRMLIRREVVTFPGQPGGPELHWRLQPEGNRRGEQVATHWLVNWADDMYERRADFTMAASHELRGPLTALRGFAETLNADPGSLTPEQAEAAAIIERTARHLTVLVEDVFDLSRNSFGELRLELRETGLDEVARSVVSVIRPRAEQRGQTLECEVEPGLPSVEADQARAVQMVSNLVNNASIHNSAGISILVSARREGERIAISVEDDGKGLPFDDPEDAFRAFRRGEAATEGDRAGSGIGLSVTRRLIELHRGQIDAESRPGEGARFTLWFPLNRGAALAPGEPGPV